MKTSLFLLVFTLCLTGCDRIRSLTGDTKDSATAEKPAGMQLCFTCNGHGTNACPAPTCKDGLADCPGPCLKLSMPGWHQMDMPGHGSNELWIAFNDTTGGGSRSWNQYHVGEVVEMQNGVAINIGKCTVCGGQAKMKCTACDGTGLMVCPTCEGKKFVPATWTAQDNPKLAHPPGTILLRDGRTLNGKIEMQIGSQVTIRTPDGKTEQIDAADIVTDAPKK